MSAEPESIQNDLAFMRGLVEAASGGFPVVLGEVYVAGGVCYGLQVVLQGTQALLGVAWPPLANLAIGFGPTVVFLLAFLLIVLRAPKQAPGGVASRAIGVLFGAIGMANLVMIAVIGSVAWRRHSLEIWLIYPCVVFVLQGTAWMAAGAVRRRLWLNLVALGWFATALCMGFSIENQSLFAVFAGIGLIGFMAIPGLVMMRLARAGA
jgi:hypothetical protein